MLAYIFLMNQCLTRAGGSDKTDCFAGVGRALVLVIVMLVVLVLVVFVLIMVVKTGGGKADGSKGSVIVNVGMKYKLDVEETDFLCCSISFPKNCET